MKKSFLILLLIILSFLMVGCNLMTYTTTTPTDTTTVSTTTTTPDPRYDIIDQEFDYLSPRLPEGMIANYYLPELNNQEITSSISLDGVLLESNLIPFTASPVDLYCVLSITLFYQELSKTKEFTIVMLRDSSMYQQYLIDQAFEEIKLLVDAEMPSIIESDFTLPVLENTDATVSFSTDTSRIYNHRFIFTFPLEETTIHITARIRYNNETRTYVYPIIMKRLSELYQIPTIYINTDYSAPINSKIDYVHATFNMSLNDFALNTTESFTNLSVLVRGRGNSTFFMPKQSFKLKFDVKTSLLFDHQEHDWVLLANFSDQTLIRNYLAYHFAQSITDAYEPVSAFVDVYLNNVYIGNYTLTDQIEVTNDRVNIEEHSANQDTGYLLEFDKRILSWPEGTEGIDWFNLYGIPYAIKSPDTRGDTFSQNQFNYIASYTAECYNVIKDGEDYSAWIDEESFIDWFIAEELFKNVDSGYSSVYLMKDKGGKLKMGPVWDFDLSTSNPGHLSADLRAPEGWYTNRQDKNIWYYYLMKYDVFQEHLKAKWNAIYDVQIKDLLQSVYPVSDSISKSRYLNFQTWDIIGKNLDWYTSTEVYEAKTYEEQVYILYNYLLIRSRWLNDAINNL